MPIFKFSSSTLRMTRNLQLLLLALAAINWNANALETVNCSEYQSFHAFEVPINFSYVVTEEILSAQVVYEGQGYVALAISPNGRMRGSLAIIGLPDEEEGESVKMYNLVGYGLDNVQLSDQQTLLSSDITQNETHTVLTFTKLLKEVDQELEIVADTGVTSFLVAAGSTNSLGYHLHKASVGLRLETCLDETEEIPSQVLSPTGVANCSEYQATHSFGDLPLTMQYVVSEEGIFSARVTYEGQGYVSWAISPEGRMPGSLAVIGLPDTGAVEQYDMAGYSLTSVTLADTPTLLSASVEQNDTHTVLEFSKYLRQEEGQLEVVADGRTRNFFLVAAGMSNGLGLHTYRAAVSLPVQVCRPGQAMDDSQFQAVEIKNDNKQVLFKAHGWLAAIAWGILAPLAIASSLCRHLIPQAGLWFQIHFYANFLVLLLTIASFALAVKAIQATEGGNHFQAREGALGKHKTLGLVVTILVILQAIGGMVRPGAGKAKTPVRALWEAGHRAVGLALLGMSYYQCHSGLVLYANRFMQENDYVTVFWIVTGMIVAAGVLGGIHKVFVYKEPEVEETDSDSGNGKNDSSIGDGKNGFRDNPIEA